MATIGNAPVFPTESVLPGNLQVTGNATVSGNATISGSSTTVNGNEVRTVGTSGAILQVKSSIKTDIFSTTSTSFADVSDLSVAITPSSTSNKVLVLVTLGANGNTTSSVLFNLVRGSTTLAQPDSGANPSTINLFNTGTTDVDNAAINFLDSPSTTSSTTYKIQMRVDGGTGYLNRHTSNTNYNSVSTITVMEVAG